MRARDDADLSGAILNPPLRSKSLSSYETRINLSLSLFLSSLKGFKARGRGTRERDERVVVSERKISSFDCLSLNAFLQISFPIKSSSLSNKSERISLSLRERKCLACCKMRDTKSTPKRLHANKKIKRD